MTVEAPPRPRRVDGPVGAHPAPEADALIQALIEEARQRARRRRRRLALLIGLVVLSGAGLAWLFYPSTPSPLEPSSRESSVVSAGRSEPRGTIAVTQLNGPGRPSVRLWTARGFEGPRIRGVAFGWAPDGRRLLVQRGSALWVVTPDTGREVRLTRQGSGFDAAWSPDGSRVVFAGERVRAGSSWRRIVVVEADGSGARTVSGWVLDGGFFTGNVSWSPDGREIVFAGRTAFSQHRWLYRVASDGASQPRPLAFDGSVSVPAQPTWSPDGSRLAFSDSGTGSIGDLVLAHADGRTIRRFAGGTGPVWSPDGSALAFRVHHAVSGAWTVHADGTHLTRLPLGSWAGLSWSPDSRYIAYAGGLGHEPSGELFVTRPDGTGVTRIIELPAGTVGLPLWRHGTATTEAG